MTLSPEERAVAEEALRTARLHFDPEEPGWSFDAARGCGWEAYADHVIGRARALDPLRAACEDVADVMGATDYHETTPALRAVAEQWRHLADRFEPEDAHALHLRRLVLELETLLADPEQYDEDHATDLISMACQRDELLDLAATFRQAEESGGVDAWWEEHGATAALLAGSLQWFRDDLDQRGEDRL